MSGGVLSWPLFLLMMGCFILSAGAVGPLSRLAAFAGERGQPGVPNCTMIWHEQIVDHFDFHQPTTGNLTFKQRVFYYDRYWKPGGPIFFYTGNEANVELYVNATGLMWENAESFGALHMTRYCGRYVFTWSERILCSFSMLRSARMYFLASPAGPQFVSGSSRQR